ncbi:hypothetical protein B1757_13855 [Acidithiobacillus marinus]|uniref:Uncharacterized protein n=1 Tax=Acidithiobacillus marinus TaxID=187490 RepID=A0A2I1DIH7_9PROT|nr:hypothetical protein [Acidithiobacillus marinus]PKY09683.1 hypothetical protein B1757_13855 [Acidithiobacillus marinus]
MIEFELSPHHAGVTLWGEYDALRRLHTFIHRVVEESIFIERKDGFVLALAYDFRKAYENQRERTYRSNAEDQKIRIYGVGIVWPMLLVQVGVLRQALAFMPGNKLDQSLMFELEYVVELALQKALPTLTHEEIDRMIYGMSGGPYKHLENILDSRCRYFVGLSPEKRLKSLPMLMETFNPMHEYLASAGIDTRPGIIHPDAFIDSERCWPDFEW